MDPYRVRLHFEKTGDLRLISHRRVPLVACPPVLLEEAKP